MMDKKISAVLVVVNGSDAIARERKKQSGERVVEALNAPIYIVGARGAMKPKAIV